MDKEYYISQGYDIEKSTTLQRDFLRYKTAKDKWARRGLEYEMVVNNDVDGTGTQFTTAELEEIRERNGIPLSVNVSVAFIEQLQSFLTSSKPSVSCIPIGDSSKAYAYVHREIILTLLYLNDFYIKMEKTIFNMAVVGHGILYITLADFFSKNSFNVNIKSLNWRNCYFDPLSQEADYQDSEKVFLVFPMTKSKAKKIYGLTDEDMKFATENIENYAGFTNNDIAFTNIDTKEVVFVYEIFEKVSATLNILENGKKVFDSIDNQVVDESGELVSFIRGIRVVDSIDSTFVKRYLKVGNYIKDERILPITQYPFVIYNHTHNYSPYPYGLVHHFVDLQHTLNKCLALTIQNAQVGSNVGYMAPEGSITDKNKFQKDMSTPGSVAEFNADQNLVNNGIPIARVPAQLSNAWYTLFQQLIKLIEYITGIYDLSMGSSENAPNTLGATQSIQSFGTQRPKMYARRVDIANQKLGEILIEFYQAFAPQENLMTLINESEAMVEIQTNVSAIIDKQTQEAKIDPRGFDKVTVVKNMATQEVMTILGDIRVGQYKVRFTSSSDLPTTRAAALQMLTSLMSRMSSDSMAIAIAQSALKLMDYPEIDKVLRDTDIINQLQQQVMQQQKQLEETMKQNKELMNENDTLERKAKDSELSAEVDKRLARIDLATDHFEKKKAEIEKQDEINKREPIT